MSKQELFDYFADCITDERRALFLKNIEQRTRYITVVLEDIYQAHNFSAVLRTADCFGIQDVHVLEGRHSFVVNKEVAKGAAQWLTLKKTDTKTQQYYDTLRKQGYHIVATTPHERDVTIDELSLEKPVALVFGTEQQGLSSSALEHADAFVKVPLYGFTESFNISVCAGIVLYELTKRLRTSSLDWHLTKDEQLDILIEWLARTTGYGDEIRKRLVGKTPA